MAFVPFTKGGKPGKKAASKLVEGSAKEEALDKRQAAAKTKVTAAFKNGGKIKTTKRG